MCYVIVVMSFVTLRPSISPIDGSTCKAFVCSWMWETSRSTVACHQLWSGINSFSEVSFFITLYDRFMKDELKTIQAFLVAAEEEKRKDMLLKVWAEQVRDLSYGIEDCLDEFMVHVGSQSLSQQLLKLKGRHRIAIKIRDLKSRVEEVSSRNTRYNLIRVEGSNIMDDTDSFAEDVRNHSASNIDETELVGFAKPKEELINLMDVSTKYGLSKVIFVVGMGGLGKTTLARKIYESKDDIVKNFFCCAWITVSKSFVKEDMLKDMIKKLLGVSSLQKCLKEHEGKAVHVEDLANYLREQLKEKRYFIVLDDLWAIDAWNWIKNICFPSSNDKGSRIIVTTRDVGLAKECTSEMHIYHLKPLQVDDATNLLLRKSRKTREDIENDENLRNVVTKIVNKCGCLPLAVLTIGGMLATKTVIEWENIYKQIPSELESNPSLEAMRRMVTLSYNQLPSHLKLCFLYLSIFPEDFEIQRRRLVERWIAEGFVRASGGANIEDVAKSYFTELISRNMIQPSRVNIEGTVKSCRVHDIMRDVMVSISRDENFVSLAGDNVTSVAEENFRHIAYHGSKCEKVGTDWSNVRSFTLFGERPIEPTPSLCSPDLRMLRALDLQDAQFDITQKDINNMGLLRHLKYVNVRSSGGISNIYELPRSIGKLQGLQTLEIRYTCIAMLPAQISKLQSLRSLRCSRKSNFTYFNRFADIFSVPMMFTPSVSSADRAEVIAELHMALNSRFSETDGVQVPRGIGNLKELQILETVDITRTSNRAIKELGELTQLRKLNVTTKGATKKKCKALCTAIQKLSSLQSLRVDAYQWGSSSIIELEWLHSVSSPPPLLRTLKLYGGLRETPVWIGSLVHLLKIYLERSLLKDDTVLELLGALPNLMLLSLHLDAYVGEKMVFRAGEFPNLKEIYIWYFSELHEVRFEEGTSPQMEMIEIGGGKLSSGIIGIEHLPRLKEIFLNFNGEVAKLGVLQEEVDAHPNHPVLRLQDDWNDHDLGMNISEDHGQGHVEGSNVVEDGEDDFCFCISDGHADSEDAC